MASNQGASQPVKWQINHTVNHFVIQPTIQSATLPVSHQELSVAMHVLIKAMVESEGVGDIMLM